MDPIYIILIVVGALIVIVIALYNALVRLRNQVKNSWAQIDVQLKRRSDLIPNLMNTVKGFMKHEKDVLESVTKARTAMMNAGDDVEASAAANNQLSGTLKSLFAVAENYPDLKSNTNFLQLQEELAGTENKISYARQHYNDMVMRFNTKLQTFPNNVFSSMFSFEESKSFEASESERENVKVEF